MQMPRRPEFSLFGLPADCQTPVRWSFQRHGLQSAQEFGRFHGGSATSRSSRARAMRASAAQLDGRRVARVPFPNPAWTNSGAAPGVFAAGQMRRLLGVALLREERGVVTVFPRPRCFTA